MRLVRYNPLNRSTHWPTLWENSFNDFFNDSFFLKKLENLPEIPPKIPFFFT